jgi:hypothetical protein
LFPRRIRLTVAEAILRCLSSVRALQRESPLAGAWQTVSTTFRVLCSSRLLRGRPGRGRSFSTANLCRPYSLRTRPTTCALAPNSQAICRLERPRAAHTSIGARLVLLTAVFRLRIIRSHSLRSPSSITNTALAAGNFPLYINGKCMPVIYDTMYLVPRRGIYGSPAMFPKARFIGIADSIG